MGRRRAIGGAVAAVTIAHGALLALGAGPRAAGGRAAGMLRVVVVPGRPTAAPAATAAASPAPATPPRAPAPPRAAAGAGRGGSSPRLAAEASAPAPPFPTRLPPGAERHFALWQDGRAGHASLRWRADPSGAWRLEVDTRPAGRPPRAWVSTGHRDARGLAPDRLVQVDRGREVRALNVERDRGVVGVSGREDERPLPPGLQDRWSWLVQLAAAAEAVSRPWPPGTTLSMDVAGLRGELDRWDFHVLGIDRPPPPPGAGGGPAPEAPGPLSMHLRREPARPWDLRVDAWLEPVSPHLPVALALAAPPGRWSLVLHAEPAGADRGGPADGPAIAP